MSLKVLDTKHSHTLRVSVTQLANFACRRGDLMPDAVVGPTAREGMRAHQKIQSKRKKAAGDADGVLTEHKVVCKAELESCEIQLGGRIDLVDLQANVLSEIKTTYVPAAQLSETQQELHWAQLYLYAYAYHEQQLASQLDEQPGGGVDKPLTEITLELIYTNIRAATEESLLRVVTQSELQVFANTALQCYVLWLQRVEACHLRMKETANALEFPF